jgi:hypothetical protein
MGKANYNPEIKEILDSFLLQIPIVVPGKMFGYPAYFVNKKLFACVYEEGVGLKVPSETVHELMGKAGYISFIPMGRRKMKEWIQINREKPEEYLNDQATFKIAIKHVAGLGEE